MIDLTLEYHRPSHTLVKVLDFVRTCSVDR